MLRLLGIKNVNPYKEKTIELDHTYEEGLYVVILDKHRQIYNKNILIDRITIEEIHRIKSMKAKDEKYHPLNIDGKKVVHNYYHYINSRYVPFCFWINKEDAIILKKLLKEGENYIFFSNKRISPVELTDIINISYKFLIPRRLAKGEYATNIEGYDILLNNSEENQNCFSITVNRGNFILHTSLAIEKDTYLCEFPRLTSKNKTYPVLYPVEDIMDFYGNIPSLEIQQWINELPNSIIDKKSTLDILVSCDF